LSERTLKSLVWKLAEEYKDDKEIEENCMKKLSKIASKDFEYILNLVIDKNQ
jgi:hypothetical protein